MVFLSSSSLFEIVYAHWLKCFKEVFFSILLLKCIYSPLFNSQVETETSASALFTKPPPSSVIITIMSYHIRHRLEVTNMLHSQFCVYVLPCEFCLLFLFICEIRIMPYYMVMEPLELTFTRVITPLELLHTTMVNYYTFFYHVAIFMYIGT